MTWDALQDQQSRWDQRYLELAQHVAQWSKDPSTKAGAIIVRPDRTVVSLGFNGFPRKMHDHPTLYADREVKYSRIVHAEVNALVFAREPVPGCTLYTWPFMPCDRCFVQMLQAGITRFVAPPASPEALERWGPTFDRVRQYAREAHVVLEEI